MSNVQSVQARDLRDQIRFIAEGARYLEHRYVITYVGSPAAQIIPITNDTPTETITVTDIRTRTREVLEQVRFGGKSFLVTTYGRPMAILEPVQLSLWRETLA